MSKVKLFDDSDTEEKDDNKEDSAIKVNEDYAKNYEKWRSAEELRKLKDKFGENAHFHDSESDSESSESEDEPELLANDTSWLRTLALIKTKDPRIYDPSFTFEDSNKDSKAKKTKVKPKESKPLYLRDYERKMILEAGGKPVDDDDFPERRKVVDEDSIPLTYTEEQQKLKDSFKPFLEDDEDGNELLVKKVKTTDDEEKDQSDYLKWLKGQPVQVEPSVATDLISLKEYWSNPDLPENERFLRDFIIQGKVDRKESVADIEKNDGGKNGDDIDLDSDESEIEKQDEFERKFNFRFEEPDPVFIKSFPRTVSESLRKKVDARAKKREELKKRKEQKKTERREELRQLKRLKRNEIADKIKHLQKIAGGGEQEDLGFKPEDLEGDYNPIAHAEMLNRVFDNNYFDVAEEVRPNIDMDDEILAKYGKDVIAEAGSDWEEPVEHEEEQIKDDNQQARTSPERDSNRPWRRKKSRIAMALEKEKPDFNPAEKTFEEYLNEYYKLDYEDVVGEMPCRFKYRKVEPVDFGIDAKEILKARDKELNSWVSIKRVVQYRNPEDDLKDKRRYQQKAQNSEKKLKILPSLRDSKDDQTKSEDKNTKKDKTINKTKKSNPLAAFTDDRLKAYGLEPRKFKYTKNRFVQQNCGETGANMSSKSNKNKKRHTRERPVFA